MYIERILMVMVLALTMHVETMAQAKVDCSRVGSVFGKKICSSLENNQAAYIKDLMQRKSGENTQERTMAWMRQYYECFYCDAEPGFRGGGLLRKVVYEDALSICFFFVYDARVDMNTVERDGKTLIDWLQDDTESAFDAAFETENESDKKYLMKQIQTGQKYFNIFRNNGAKFRHELRQGGSKY